MEVDTHGEVQSWRSKKTMNRILIIPSWYKSPDSPSAGSFFEEQAMLMASSYTIYMFVMERYYLDNLESFVYKPPIHSLENKCIHVYRLIFPQSHSLSPDENLKIQISFGKHGFIDILKEINSNFALIHAQATFPAGIIAQHLSKLYNIPYIITEHFGPFNPDFLHSKYVKKEMFSALECANSVLSVSYHLRQQILMQGIKCNPKVVGNLVDDNLFCIKKKKRDKCVKLLCVAYYPGFIKDLDNLFSALIILKDNSIDFHMIIVGGGEPQGGNKGHNLLYEIKQKYDLDEEVTIIGSCNRNEMRNQMQLCDIYVSSSISETFGVCICEAMLCGKPVVLTKNGGSADFTDITNSISVEIHDSEQLAHAIIKMTNLYSSFDSNIIRDKIVKRFGRKAFFDRMASIYNKYLKNP